MQGIFEIPPEFVVRQIDSVLSDIGADAVKTGMLYLSGDRLGRGRRVRRWRVERLVVDPVMVAKSGDALLRPEAISALVAGLLPLALVATPNAHEASILAGMDVRTPEDAHEAARRIAALGPRYVVVKGGHLAGAECVEFLRRAGVHGVSQPKAARAPHAWHGLRLRLGHRGGSGARSERGRGGWRGDGFLERALAEALEIGHGWGRPTILRGGDAICAEDLLR